MLTLSCCQCKDRSLACALGVRGLTPHLATAQVQLGAQGWGAPGQAASWVGQAKTRSATWPRLPEFHWPLHFTCWLPLMALTSKGLEYPGLCPHTCSAWSHLVSDSNTEDSGSGVSRLPDPHCSVSISNGIGDPPTAPSVVSSISLKPWPHPSPLPFSHSAQVLWAPA